MNEKSLREEIEALRDDLLLLYHDGVLGVSPDEVAKKLDAALGAPDGPEADSDDGYKILPSEHESDKDQMMDDNGVHNALKSDGVKEILGYIDRRKCGNPCPPDDPCERCKIYWHRMKVEGLWDGAEWTKKGWKEITK